jgi:hypothetical protein
MRSAIISAIPAREHAVPPTCARLSGYGGLSKDQLGDVDLDFNGFNRHAACLACDGGIEPRNAGFSARAPALPRRSPRRRPWLLPAFV